MDSPHVGSEPQGFSHSGVDGLRRLRLSGISGLGFQPQDAERVDLGYYDEAWFKARGLSVGV